MLNILRPYAEVPSAFLSNFYLEMLIEGPLLLKGVVKVTIDQRIDRNWYWARILRRGRRCL